ncbi:MAG: hypothetical protein HDS67_10315 [Bacteroidales bacterium]|nr:hypothetical protein [Bacteroidales bacterium]
MTRRIQENNFYATPKLNLDSIDWTDGKSIDNAVREVIYEPQSLARFREAFPDQTPEVIQGFEPYLPESYHLPLPLLRHTLHPQAYHLLTRLESILTAPASPDSLSPDQALIAATHYELLYRQTDPTLHRLEEVYRILNDTIYRAFEQYRRTPNPDLTHPLFAAISDTLRRRPERRFLGRPFDWHARQLDTWLTALLRHQPPTIPLSQAANLLNEDLYPWLGSAVTPFMRTIAKTALTFLPNFYYSD